MKVLIVEDDQSIIESLKIAFQMRWPEAELHTSHLGEKGVEMAEELNPEIVVLDLGLPDIDGFTVLKRIRLFSKLPIIILTVRGDERDIVKGLEWGADDYIVKPFKQMEFLSRVKALVRRQLLYDADVTYTKGPFRFAADLHKLFLHKKSIVLTNSECIIFSKLLTNAGNTVTYSSLATELWGEDYPGASEAIRVYVHRLREKLEDNPDDPKIILTKVNLGYTLCVPD